MGRARMKARVRENKILAFFTLYMFRTQRQSAEGRVLITSHITLIVLYVVFILATAASRHSDYKAFCGTVSGLFHYFSIAYFYWMETDAAVYGIKLKYGMDKGFYTRHFYLIRSLLAWGKCAYMYNEHSLY